MAMNGAWKLKDGVAVDGLNEAFAGEEWAFAAYAIEALAQAVPTITAGTDGKHSANSTHYAGNAVDVRINDWKCSAEPLAKAVAGIIGHPYVVVMEPDHLHIQLGKCNIAGSIAKAGRGWFIKSKRCR